MTYDRLASRIRYLPEQLERARGRVAQLEREARELRMFDLLPLSAADPAAGTARRAERPLPHPPRHPPKGPAMTTQDQTWVLDVHLDTQARAVMLSATCRATRTVHFEPLELLTVAAVCEGVQRLIERHGRPELISTDNGALWAGLGAAIGVLQWTPQEKASDAWIERLARQVAA